jgi:hypothetical protein
MLIMLDVHLLGKAMPLLGLPRSLHQVSLAWPLLQQA